MQLEAHRKSDSFKKAKVKAAVCNRVLLQKQLSKRSKVAVTILEAARTARLHGLRRRCGVPDVNSVPVPRLCDRCSDCNINVEDVFATITLHCSLFADSTSPQSYVVHKHTVAVENQGHGRQHVHQLGDNTSVGPAFPKLRPALTTCSRLYRRALKLSLDWTIERRLWRGQAMYIRSLFEAQRNVREPRQTKVR